MSEIEALSRQIELAGVNGPEIARDLAELLLASGPIEFAYEVVRYIASQAKGNGALLAHIIKHHGPRRMELIRDARSIEDRYWARFRKDVAQARADMSRWTNQEMRRRIVARFPECAEVYDMLGLDY